MSAKAAVPVHQAKGFKNKVKLFKKNFSLTLMAVPGFAWFVIFSYLPLIGLLIAFKDFKIYGSFFQNLMQSEWVGLRNFEFLFATKDAVKMIRNTVGYNAVFIILNIVVPLVLAIVLNSLLNKKSSKIYQTLMFFPYFLSWVVVNYFVFAFLSPDKGLVNSIMGSMGLSSKTNWYIKPELWPFLLVFVNTWKGLGYNIVIYLASIIGIDRTYYEAAELDGASKFKQATQITLPMLRGMIAILFLMAVGKIFNSDIGLFYTVTRDSGSLYDATQTIDTYVFRVMKTLGDYTKSSAAAAFQSVVGFVVILVSNFIIRKIDRDSALF